MRAIQVLTNELPPTFQAVWSTGKILLCPGNLDLLRTFALVSHNVFKSACNSLLLMVILSNETFLFHDIPPRSEHGNMMVREKDARRKFARDVQD